MTLVSANAPDTSQVGQRSRTPLALFFRDRVAMIGLVIGGIIMLLTALGPLIAPYGPNDADPALRLGAIGTPGHLLGLDHQGRDILSRMLWGSGLTLITAFLPVVVGALLAIPIGLVAAWYEKTGSVIMRIMDVLFAFPMALLAILITAVLGPGMTNLMISLVLVLLPYNVRVVYQAAQGQRSLPYVEGLRASGTPVFSLLFRELLPNVASPALVYATTVLGSIVITAAGLSFLGLGVQPPTPEWGIMISEGRSLVFTAPHVAVIPGIALTLLVISCNLIGDGIRDVLDPRTRATMR
jgi:peptide/nickel transport system permease protein